MSNLVHYGKEEITLNDTDYRFSDFLKLDGEYCVPFGFNIRVYERGVVHYISDGFTTIHLPKIDSYCDSLCARESELRRLIRIDS
jgi:hypothetical protein